MTEKTVSFASSPYCDGENNSGIVNTVHHTSTPFVHSDKNTAANDLNGSIFDQPSSVKERPSLEISCIPPLAPSSNDISREKSESCISEDVSSCGILNESFIQSSSSSSVSGTNSVSACEESVPKPKDTENTEKEETTDPKCINNDSRTHDHLEKEGSTKSQNGSSQDDQKVDVCEDEQVADESVGAATSLAKPSAVPVQNSSTISSSRYLEDSSKKKDTKVQKNDNSKKRKRLTMAERRTLEALELFGGSLDTVLQKTESFGDKLQKQRELIKAQEESCTEEPKSKRNRLETARVETALLFKDIPFGESKQLKHLKNSADSTVSAEGGKRLTRLQKAKMEAIQSFGGSGLDEILGLTKGKSEPKNEVESQSSDVEGNKENATADILANEEN